MAAWASSASSFESSRRIAGTRVAFQSGRLGCGPGAQCPRRSRRQADPAAPGNDYERGVRRPRHGGRRTPPGGRVVSRATLSPCARHLAPRSCSYPSPLATPTDAPTPPRDAYESAVAVCAAFVACDFTWPDLGWCVESVQGYSSMDVSDKARRAQTHPVTVRLPVLVPTVARRFHSTARITDLLAYVGTATSMTRPCCVRAPPPHTRATATCSCTAQGGGRRESTAESSVSRRASRSRRWASTPQAVRPQAAASSARLGLEQQGGAETAPLNSMRLDQRRVHFGRDVRRNAERAQRRCFALRAAANV